MCRHQRLPRLIIINGNTEMLMSVPRLPFLWVFKMLDLLRRRCLRAPLLLGHYPLHVLAIVFHPACINSECSSHASASETRRGGVASFLEVSSAGVTVAAVSPSTCSSHSPQPERLNDVDVQLPSKGLVSSRGAGKRGRMSCLEIFVGHDSSPPSLALTCVLLVRNGPRGGARNHVPKTIQ